MQDRWVTYIYRYHAQMRGENVGFMKAQKISTRANDSVRFQIGIKLYKVKPCKCTIHLVDGRNIYKIKEIMLAAQEHDTVMLRFEIPWRSPVGLDKVVTDYMGLYFMCEDGECCGGFWHEELPVPEEYIPVEHKPEEYKSAGYKPVGNKPEEYKPEEYKSAEYKPVGNKPEEYKPEEYKSAEYKSVGNKPAEYKPVEYTQVIGTQGRGDRFVPASEVREWKPKKLIPESQKTDYHAMLDTYPKLPLFTNSRLIKCVKIMPQDIGRLPIGNWKLGTNSFVTHGFYHYQYLMLGNVMLEQGERLVIGIPGVFTSKEKYVANMFGFARFVPAQQCDYMTGRFGYWISEVVSE